MQSADKNSASNKDTKAKLIRSGLEHLTETGFVSTGIDTILKSVGVPKGSFYFYFKSKEAFGQAVIESYSSYFANRLDKFLLNSDELPLNRIRNFVEDAKNGMAKYEFKRGCLIGNLGQEVGLLPISYRQSLIDIFNNWQARIAVCLADAQSCNQLSHNADCDRLAEYFWSGWEGAVSRAKLEQSVRPLDNYIDGFIAGLPR